MSDRPRFSDLDPAESEALLARHHIGHLAFAHAGQVDVEPIHYVRQGEWVYCRTAEGSKLTALGERPWVALEVDEIEGPFDWKSVVAHGTVYLVGPGPEHRAAHQKTLAAIRAVHPAALTPDDPVPERTTLLRIHIRKLTGRQATTHP
ncbi:MAG TPA: pyridoxamine 5'-phosphate oxidase family protein [Gemmatimonadales bacterium]|nr:pyridoxamine 5'-phosphate oxidase family protein [Gemmatimonadales bacterium]